MGRYNPDAKIQSSESTGRWKQAQEQVNNQFEPQRQELIKQGLPVGLNKRKAEPTAVGGMIRGAVKLVANPLTNLVNATDIATGGEGNLQPYSGRYLGKVEGLGKVDMTKSPLDKENLKTIKKSVGTGLEIASYLSYGGAGKTVVKGAISKMTETAAKDTFAEFVVKNLPKLIKEGALTGAAMTGGTQLNENAETGKKFSWKQAAQDVAISSVLTPIAGIGLQKLFGKSTLKILNARQDVRDALVQSYKNAIPEMGTKFDTLPKPKTNILEDIFNPNPIRQEVTPAIENTVESKSRKTVPVPTKEGQFMNNLVEGRQAVLEQTIQEHAIHPATKLNKIIPENIRKTNFLDKRNINEATTRTEAAQIIKQNTLVDKRLKALESATQGTKWSDNFDNYDTVNEIFDDFKAKGDDIVSQKTYLKETKNAIKESLAGNHEKVKKILAEGNVEDYIDNVVMSDQEKFRIKDTLAEKGIKISDKQEQDILKLNKKIFGDESVEVTQQILSNNKALGSYKEGLIKILDGQADPKDTFFHEVGHKILQSFTTRRERIEIFTEARKQFGINNLADVEEMLNEGLVAYAKDKTGFKGTLKLYFDKILARVKSYLGNKKVIDELYADILLGNKERVNIPGTPKFKSIEGNIMKPEKDEYEAPIEVLKRQFADDPNFTPTTFDRMVNTFVDMKAKYSNKEILDMLYKDEIPDGITRSGLYGLMKNVKDLTIKEQQRLTNRVFISQAGQDLVAAKLARGEMITNPVDMMIAQKRLYVKRLKKLGVTKNTIKRFLTSVECVY